MLCAFVYIIYQINYAENFMKLKQVKIYTDGACSSNPGPGGWGAVLDYNGHRKELSGGEAATTNNRMELTAAIKAVEALKEQCEVILTSDSKYLVDGIEKGWAKSWQQKGWMRGKNQPAQNPDLWERLLELLEFHKVSLVWVKGHNGHPENERCDELAVSETNKFKV